MPGGGPEDVGFLFFGDKMAVSAGGDAIGAVLNDGVQTLSGGAAERTVINAGGEAIVSSGSVARGTMANNGGGLFVSSRGVALDTVISGEEIVSSGGKSVGTTISFAAEYVESGGVARGTMVSGGEEIISSGGKSVVATTRPAPDTRTRPPQPAARPRCPNAAARPTAVTSRPHAGGRRLVGATAKNALDSRYSRSAVGNSRCAGPIFQFRVLGIASPSLLKS
jgi:autotransporter passenger strand-loop-strand repeat protein